MNVYPIGPPWYDPWRSPWGPFVPPQQPYPRPPIIPRVPIPPAPPAQPLVIPQRGEVVPCKACEGTGERKGKVCSGCKGAGVHRV